MCFSLLGAAFTPPDFCLRQMLKKLDPSENLISHGPAPPSPISLATALILLRFCLCRWLCAKKIQACHLRSQSLTTRASAPRCRSRKGTRGPRPPLSSTEALSNSLWDSHNATHDTDVEAAEAQLQRTIHDDSLRHPGSLVHNHSFLVQLCDAHILDMLMAQATQGHLISLELHQVLGPRQLCVGFLPFFVTHAPSFCLRPVSDVTGFSFIRSQQCFPRAPRLWALPARPVRQNRTFLVSRTPGT